MCNYKIELLLMVMLIGFIVAVIAHFVYSEFFTEYACEVCRDKGVLRAMNGFSRGMYQDCIHCDKYDFEGFRAYGNY